MRILAALTGDGLCAARRDLARNLAQEELATLLNTMLARLQTSHTVVYTPQEQAYYLLFDVFAASARLRDHTARYFPSGKVELEGIGVFTRRIGARVFIEAVVQATPAQAAGLLAGDEIWRWMTRLFSRSNRSGARPVKTSA